VSSRGTLLHLAYSLWICRNLPKVNQALYPSHLSSLCLHDLQSYCTLLLPNSNRERAHDDSYLVKDGDTIVEMTGNW
jgi:hypothetical protein